MQMGLKGKVKLFLVPPRSIAAGIGDVARLLIEPEAQLFVKTSERSEQGYIFAPGELGERPAVARRAGNRVVFTRRSDRGGFLLVTFLCPSKEKSPAVGQPPTSNTRAKPARQKIISPLSLALSRQGRGK
ncbi:MAG: hypothetical protein A3E57_06120 [Candidatus Muproteobacteria bacterium RIFCSPHIGHO2_12_FULL_60_33]|uniref:Uncharacterized protein n=1 Tax=Candidatus Muproteobacteria bacterium RIFCSPLOWO2_01_FULL_60_18 TaxID=1817768 RepID=A0A1F6U0K6_9PROT|nr:MAG: hypothetical protein A3A87_03330 [Candidatus Muproteobacteria bacterium RIFCSPLOWO2_01_FULL_60_18]OGI54728.1 MAG: hypothetical protein A3E57_06120 [Candidatus Muproteobacteria bacterium RIFCSPHIGHO2_12_FULL_60_33]OGI58928.1 MAG: hypothetical protein A2809_00180 [Candidatus Muproteobacteria bacterium RIFCSPHIGHO2_01_FULL_61_200]